MAKQAREILPENLLEHRAVQAWRRLEPERIEPEHIEILRLHNKTAVYRLAGVGPNGSSVVAKRCRIATGSIERIIYEEFLARLPVAALRCYGMTAEPDGEFCWLFLEMAEGKTYSATNGSHRLLAGRWLATIHRAAAEWREVSDKPLEGRLPSRGAAHYVQMLRAVRNHLSGYVCHSALRRSDRAVLKAIISHCDVLEAQSTVLESICASMPPTLIHGDLAEKNVRVQSQGQDGTLLVFDWECAAWGVPATDLAQFAEKTISPDLKVYRQVTTELGSEVENGTLTEVSQCGAIFRSIDIINWTTARLGPETYGSEAHRFLQKPLACLQIYERQLANTLSAAEWMR